MRVPGLNPMAAAAGSRAGLSALSAYVAGFVVVFVLAAGTGLVALFAGGQLSGGLLALTLGPASVRSRSPRVCP